jgi:peptidoglycan/LPS O-acetylase OafA/YrhL
MKWSLPLLAAFTGVCGIGFWILAVLGYTVADQAQFTRGYNGLMLLFGVACTFGFGAMAFEKPLHWYSLGAAALSLIISVAQTVKMREGWQPHLETARMDLFWFGLFSLLMCFLFCRQITKKRRKSETPPSP